MSPILDLQQRLTETGRIRLGTQEPTGSGKMRPAKLETFRLTSANKRAIEAAAALWGGKVTAWDNGQWQVFTEANELSCMLPPGTRLSQWWELWSGGGCQRRCDGIHEHLSDKACMCPSDYTERRESAQNGKACKPTSRLSVILPDLPGIGVWRLETHGYNAAVEMAQMAKLIEHATAGGVLIPAVLRLEWRRRVHGGQTKVYPVPVLDIAGAPRELVAAQQQAAALDQAGPVYQPVAELPAGRDVASAVRAVEQGVSEESKPNRARAAEPIGARVPPPPPPSDDEGWPADPAGGEGEGAEAPQPPPIAGNDDAPPAVPNPDSPFQPPPGWESGPSEPAEPGEETTISDAQRRRLFAIAKTVGVATPRVREIIEEVTGSETTKMAARFYEEVCERIESEGAS